MAFWDYFTDEFYAAPKSGLAVAIEEGTQSDIQSILQSEEAARQQQQKLLQQKQFKNEITKYVTIGGAVFIGYLFLKSLK